MNTRTLVIVLVVLILIPVILEQTDVSFSEFFKNPKKAFPIFFNNVLSFYAELFDKTIGNWVSSFFNNLFEQNIKNKKIEIELK
jgi:hypothetical protein